MQNLESAKVAIEAELALARRGLAHYRSRIEALSETLAQLACIDGSAVTSRKPSASAVKRSQKMAQVKPAKAAGKQKYERTAKGGDELPFTGGSYWTDLITAQPQSGADILHAAIATLGFTPTKAQVQKLTNRLTFALHALVRSGKIQDSGSGRERRFFKR